MEKAVAGACGNAIFQHAWWSSRSPEHVWGELREKEFPNLVFESIAPAISVMQLLVGALYHCGRF